MASAVSGLFGGNKAQKQQERLLAKQQADLDAVEAGQRRTREGGRGLLSFVDDSTDNSGDNGLASLLGQFKGRKGLFQAVSTLGASS